MSFFVLMKLTAFINADHMFIYVTKRKNDQFRAGHTSYLVRSRNELLRFCRSLIHHIRLFVVSLSPNLASISTLARACLFILLERNLRSAFFVDDVSKYDTHSMRSGAASKPTCRHIPGDLLDMHAGWRCPSSKNKYIKHSIEDRLSVSKSLLL